MNKLAVLITLYLHFARTRWSLILSFELITDLNFSKSTRRSVSFRWNENKIKLGKEFYACRVCDIIKYRNGTGFPLPVTDWLTARARTDTARWLRPIQANSSCWRRSDPIISSVNHCVMSPTFRERRSYLRRRKRNERKQGLRREWLGFHAEWWLREDKRHVSALIITFPAVLRVP